MKKHVSRKQSVHAGFAASAMSDSHQGFKSSFKIKLVCTIVCVALIVLAAPGAFATTDSSEEGFSSVAERSYTDEEGLSAQEDLEAAAEDTIQATDTATKATAQPENVIPQSVDQASYTLYLTHCFQYTVAGEEESIQALEKINLSDADFKNGSLDLSRFVYETEYAEPLESGTLALEAFGSDGVANTQITYAVRDGWRACTSEASSESASGISTMSVFTGNLEDITFVPAKVIRVNAEYLYSNTGGLAGTHAASSQTVEAIPTAIGNGQYQITWKLPTIAGFRVVLDPGPLNAYLVNPPMGDESPDELEAALDRGDFNVDVDNKTVYYYQQDPNETLNPTYFNRYSDDYNKAWNEARGITGKDASGNTLFTAQAVGEESRDVDGPGANALVNPELQLTLTEDQLDALLKSEDELDVTVFYRRNATWYTVNHWVPVNLSNLSDADIASKSAEEKCSVDGVDYVLVDKPETLQGRVGALTNAQAKTSGIYEKLSAIGFSQKIIENATTVAEDEPSTSGTAVDIYYQVAESYRVIFDTNYTYIPRQQVKIGEDINFAEVNTPSRTGYEFSGWQYLKRDAVPNADGEYADDDYVPVGTDGSGNYKLTLDDTLLSDAKFQDTGGVLALHLYPIWTPTDTHVRVIFWTEDLTGEDDVQATATGGDSSYYNAKYAEFADAPVTHTPEIGESETGYSNMGSFVLGGGDGTNGNITLKTGDSLVHNDGGKQVLNSEIQAKIDEEFERQMGDSNGINLDQFYTQAAFEIVHESGGHAEHDAMAASADGKTTIYVYYTRNIYTLQFHYYGSARGNNFSVAYCTNGYSYGNVEDFVSGDEFNYNYGYDGTWNGNLWAAASVTSDNQMNVPQTITVKAKYGADLHDVWPSAQSDEMVGAGNNTYHMISWATTQGKYRDDALSGSGSSHENEPTIMGTYGGMSSEIIAKPDNPDTAHHLVAYWYNVAPSYYRYNQCAEIPDLNINSSGVKKIVLYGDGNNEANVLYLVPKKNPVLEEYGFDDLLPVSYDDATGAINYDDENGEYYAVRAYTDNGMTKYYAVARRENVQSTNIISEQNPSAKLHMTRAVQNAVHTTQYRDDQGRVVNGDRVGSVDNPYDLYFYYDRNRYTITYMVPHNNMNAADSEEVLGTVTLPYGALVKKAEYGFNLNYQHTNKNASYAWNTDGIDEKLVCPDHSVSGTATWDFTGWALGPAGVNMQWTMSDETQTALQDEDDFRISSNLRLYAIWQQPSYTVTFHLNGGTASREQIEVTVPANTRYAMNGTIPRPVRTGYTLDGWYEADENGNAISPQKEFDFDQNVTSNLHVVAEWTAISTERFDYNVYYVTQELNDADVGKNLQTVRIDAENDQLVADGGDEYYVLEKAQQTDQQYVSGAMLNLTAKEKEGYVPLNTNKALALTNPGGTYDVVFYYAPITSGSHQVRFVEAGTEASDNPHVVLQDEVQADQLAVTPRSSLVTQLADAGYELVNKDTSGSYASAVSYEGLTWIDDAGNLKTPQDFDTLNGDSIPGVITYLVQPITYTIQYKVADDAPDGAAELLGALTAPEGTSLADVVDGKNPTQYTVKDGFTVKNPGRLIVNDKRYRFSHWSLGDGTQAISGSAANDEYAQLKVEPGTAGNLVFVANWAEVIGPVGNLMVTNTVTGDAGETDRDFSFTVTLDDQSINGSYGEMAFEGGVATFTLKSGESITAEDLPEGIVYRVEQDAVEGYTTTVNDTAGLSATGTVVEDQTVTAVFVNDKNAIDPSKDPGNDPGNGSGDNSGDSSNGSSGANKGNGENDGDGESSFLPKLADPFLWAVAVEAVVLVAITAFFASRRRTVRGAHKASFVDRSKK